MCASLCFSFPIHQICLKFNFFFNLSFNLRKKKHDYFFRLWMKLKLHTKKLCLCLNGYIPTFFSIIFNASIAETANNGGNDAEKQYP